MAQRGLRRVAGQGAAPPYTRGPYTWDQQVTWDRELVMTTDAVAQNYRSIIIDNTITGGIVGAVSKLNAIEQTITHSTTNMPNLRLKCADWTIVCAKNVKDVYAVQLEVDIDSACVVSGQLGCLSTAVQLNSSGSHTGEIQALYASVGGSGAGTCTELTVAKIGFSATGVHAKAIIEFGCAAYAHAHTALLLDGEGTADYFLTIPTAGGMYGSVVTSSVAGSGGTNYIKVYLGGVAHTIACVHA